jgi:hypothetical protein
MEPKIMTNYIKKNIISTIIACEPVLILCGLEKELFLIYENKNIK